jgi:hypothetical protein
MARRSKMVILLTLFSLISCLSNGIAFAQEADVAREPMKPRGAGEAPETQDSTAGPNVRIEFCTS